MKINYGKILIIIILSSAIGIIYNIINPSGLRLIPKNSELKWASDSILTSQNKIKDTVKIQQPAIHDSVNKTKNENKVLKIKEVPKENKTKGTWEDNGDSGFDAPLAINLEQAYKLYQMDFIFIDARDRVDYNAGRIKKSYSLPYLEFDKYKGALSKISKSQTIICYCGGADCELSKALANRLYFQGYHNIYVFFGGWEQWKNAGYPVE